MGGAKTTFVAIAAGRVRAGERGDAASRCIADGVLRSESPTGSEPDPATRFGAGERFGNLPGSCYSRGGLGSAIPVYRRATQSPGGASFGRRAGARPDCPVDASAG